MNGEIILLSEVRERMFQMNSLNQDPNASSTKLKEALDTLVEEKLIILFGKEKDVKNTSYEIDKAVEDFRGRAEAQGADFNASLERAGLTMERYRAMLGEQLIARKVLDMEVRNEVHISDDDVAQFYRQHADLFSARPKARISHILKYLKKTATEEDFADALKVITGIRKEITDGLDFAEAAKKYSEDPSRDTGGDLGEVVGGQMVPEFDKAAFALNPGEISQPIRTQFGWHLIKVFSKSGAEAAPMDKVKGEILNRIFMERFQTTKADWIKRIKKDALIDIKLK